jgi:hypothetical protein
MNTRLAEFLMSLVKDPARLSTFNDGEGGRDRLLAEADLPEEDKAALRSDDSAQVLRRLQATEQDGLTWVVSPAIKKFAVGFAIKVVDSPPIKAPIVGAPRIKARAIDALAIKDAVGAMARKKPAGAAGTKKKAGGAGAPAKRSGAGPSRGGGKRRKSKR